MNLDARDKIIMYELNKNARISLSMLSKKTKLSKQNVYYRIQKLEKLKIVRKYSINVDISKLGYLNYEIFFQLRHLSKDLLDFFLKNKNCRWVATGSFKFDLAVALIAKSPVEFHQILSSILMKFSTQIQSYVS